MNMTREEAAQKYGDNKIMTAPKSIVNLLIEEQAGTPAAISILNTAMISAYRRDAEFDSEYLQIIPYVIICGADFDNDDSDDLYIFTTHRIGGDNRLVGKYSIGTGGHIEDGEHIGAAVMRELEEEVGLKMGMFFDLVGNGGHFSHAATADLSLIYDPSSEVNSVHVGLILVCVVEDMNSIKVAEPDKLEGEWVKVDDLFDRFDANGLLEGWSHIALHRTFCHSPEVS